MVNNLLTFLIHICLYIQWAFGIQLIESSCISRHYENLHQSIGSKSTLLRISNCSQWNCMMSFQILPYFWFQGCQSKMVDPNFIDKVQSLLRQRLCSGCTNTLHFRDKESRWITCILCLKVSIHVFGDCKGKWSQNLSYNISCILCWKLVIFFFFLKAAAWFDWANLPRWREQFSFNCWTQRQWENSGEFFVKKIHAHVS